MGAGPSIRWVVFDVGETLIDETAVWSGWADWLGVPRFTFLGVLGSMIAGGRNHTDTFQVFRPGLDLVAAVQERLRSGSLPPAEQWFHESELYPDVRPGLAALVEAGYRVGIGANQPVQAGAALARLGLPVEFTLISDVIGVHKPDPAFFERIAAAAGCEPATIVYVGDRVDNDVIPALAAGMRVVHLRRGPWGWIQRSAPELARAVAQVDSILELPEVLGEATRRRV